MQEKPGPQALAVQLRDAFEFEKRSQLFIWVHNKTFSVTAVSISNPYCSPLAGHR
jgi:hypothetical protein